MRVDSDVRHRLDHGCGAGARPRQRACGVSRRPESEWNDAGRRHHHQWAARDHSAESGAMRGCGARQRESVRGWRRSGNDLDYDPSWVRVGGRYQRELDSGFARFRRRPGNAQRYGGPQRRCAQKRDGRRWRGEHRRESSWRGSPRTIGPCPCASAFADLHRHAAAHVRFDASGRRNWSRFDHGGNRMWLDREQWRALDQLLDSTHRKRERIRRFQRCCQHVGGVACRYHHGCRCDFHSKSGRRLPLLNHPVLAELRQGRRHGVGRGDGARRMRLDCDIEPLSPLPRVPAGRAMAP